MHFPLLLERAFSVCRRTTAPRRRLLGSWPENEGPAPQPTGWQPGPIPPMLTEGVSSMPDPLRRSAAHSGQDEFSPETRRAGSPAIRQATRSTSADADRRHAKIVPLSVTVQVSSGVDALSRTGEGGAVHRRRTPNWLQPGRRYVAAPSGLFRRMRWCLRSVRR